MCDDGNDVYDYDSSTDNKIHTLPYAEYNPVNLKPVNQVAGRLITIYIDCSARTGAGA
jgi:hypothetical protein